MTDTDVETLLNMKLREFIEKYRKELPRYLIVEENVTFKNILGLLHRSIDHEDKGAEVIVVVDNKGRPIGMIEDMELIEIMAPHSRWHLSILRPPIMRRARSMKNLLNIPVGQIARLMHPVIGEEATIKEALDHMDRLKSRYIIVVDRRDRIRAIISSRNILSKIIEKLMEVQA